MTIKAAKHVASTPSTARAYARTRGYPQNRAVAMEAACRLMMLHDSRKGELSRMAEQWAAKAQSLSAH